jgi:hypothetical protein
VRMRPSEGTIWRDRYGTPHQHRLCNSPITEYRSLDLMRTYNYKDSLDGGDVIPGFRYELKKLFRER